jgi:hypothetical protein
MRDGSSRCRKEGPPRGGVAVELPSEHSCSDIPRGRFCLCLTGLRSKAPVASTSKPVVAEIRPDAAPGELGFVAVPS